MVVKIPEQLILEEGLHYAGFKGNLQALTEKNKRRFREWYGAGPKSCSELFFDLESQANSPIAKHNLKYFLMTMNWLAAYQTESVTAGTWGVNENTVRTWSWSYVLAIQSLKQLKIHWPWEGENDETVLIITVDGIHAQIQEPRRNPGANWCSFKFKKPALAYELGIAIHSPQLVWINGPFRAGEKDLVIFRKEDGLMSRMPNGKLALGDRGYEGEPNHILTRNDLDSEEVKAYKNRALARHESFNARIKRFNIVATCFRCRHDHDGATAHDRHKAVFEAVCVIVQYEMENGHPIFDV